MATGNNDSIATVSPKMATRTLLPLIQSSNHTIATLILHFWKSEIHVFILWTLVRSAITSIRFLHQRSRSISRLPRASLLSPFSCPAPFLATTVMNPASERRILLVLLRDEAMTFALCEGHFFLQHSVERLIEKLRGDSVALLSLASQFPFETNIPFHLATADGVEEEVSSLSLSSSRNRSSKADTFDLMNFSYHAFMSTCIASRAVLFSSSRSSVV